MKKGLVKVYEFYSSWESRVWEMCLPALLSSWAIVLQIFCLQKNHGLYFFNPPSNLQCILFTPAFQGLHTSTPLCLNSVSLTSSAFLCSVFKHTNTQTPPERILYACCLLFYFVPSPQNQSEKASTVWILNVFFQRPLVKKAWYQ